MMASPKMANTGRTFGTITGEVGQSGQDTMETKERMSGGMMYHSSARYSERTSRGNRGLANLTIGTVSLFDV